MRQAGEPGLVVIADPEFAERQVSDVRQRTAELIKSLQDPKAIARARALLARYEDLWRARIDRLDDLLAEPSDPPTSTPTQRI